MSTPLTHRDRKFADDFRKKTLPIALRSRGPIIDTTSYCGPHSIGWYWSYRLMAAIMTRSAAATLSMTRIAKIR